MNKKIITIFLVSIFLFSVVIIGGMASFIINKTEDQPPSTLNITSDEEAITPVEIDREVGDAIESFNSMPPSNQISQNNLNFSVLYPPTPTSFDCDPYGGAYETRQGKVIRTNEQWKVLYDELLKNCSTKTQAPNLVDFDKQMMLSVFAGLSSSETHIEIKSISKTNGVITVLGLIVAGGPTLPSFGYPFTLVLLDKSDLPVDFEFESAKYPGPF